MKRLNQEDINTSEQYDNLYFGERTNELLAYEDVVNLLTILDPAGKVLDIGCGLGRYFKCFPKSFICATELSTQCLKSIQNEFPQVSAIKWSLGDPLPNSWTNFDLIWCGEVLEHVENPQLLIDTIYDSLKKGGVAVLTTPFEDSIKCAEHLWYFDRQDLNTLFSKFNSKSILRMSNEPIDRWEHFLIVLKKK